METEPRMHRIRWAGALAWSLCALAIGMALGGILLAARQPAAFMDDTPMVHFATLVLLILALPYGLVGAVVASRRPSNPLGWIFLAVGLLQATNVAAGTYAHYGLIWRPGSLPAVTIAQTLWSSTWFPALALIATFALLLFPDGRPLSPRWRWVVRAQAATFSVMIPAWVASAWSVRGQVIHGRSGPRLAEAAGGVLDVVVGTAVAITGVVALLAVVSLVLRFRRSRGVERQQMKWFTYAGAISVSGLLLLFASGAIVDRIGWQIPEAAEIVLVSTVMALPVAAGVAILRYRLFEIDRLVRRTVAYAVLSVVLVAIYAGLVLLLQPALRTVTSGSDLAVAATTLAVAALFGPLRRRVQRVVDRRFDRAHYDAARTIEDFAQRLRDEVNIGALADELAQVAATAVRPRSTAVWLPTAESAGQPSRANPASGMRMNSPPT